MKKLTILCLLLCVSACSNKSTYQSIQNAQINECERERNQSNREDCLKGLGTGYEEYERERTRN